MEGKGDRGRKEK